MIGYRFLFPAEEEMTEASVFTKRRHQTSALIFLTMFNVESIYCALIPRLVHQSEAD